MGVKRISWALLVVAIFAIVRSAAAQSGPPAEIMHRMNAERAAQGLGPLRWDGSLAAAAAQHAGLMARSGQLSHQYAGEPDFTERAARAGAHFSAAAENVALGPDAETVVIEWMQSPHHRENILDGRMNAVGVGVVRAGGNLYAVADFSRSVENLSHNSIEEKVGVLLRQHGIDPSRPNANARQTCEMDSGSVGTPRPLFIMRWEGSDLSRLPDQLMQRIATGRYHTAAVGACSSGGRQQAFANYKVAVLLY